MSIADETRPGVQAATDAAKRVIKRLKEQEDLRAKADAMTRANKQDLEILAKRLGPKAKREQLTATIAIVRSKKAGSVSWKDVFIKKLGADAAAKLQKSVPPKEFIEVEFTG